MFFRVTWPSLRALKILHSGATQKNITSLWTKRVIHTHIQQAAGHWGSRLTPVWLGRSSVLLSLWVACGSQVVNPVEKRVFIQMVRATVSGIKSMFWKSDIATVGLYSFLLAQFSGVSVFSISLASVILPVKQRNSFFTLSQNELRQHLAKHWNDVNNRIDSASSLPLPSINHVCNSHLK